MKRFIRYFYEYKQEKRIRNVGFVKVEAGSDETTLHMQGKGFQSNEDRRLSIYLFYMENDKIICTKQEDMCLKSPVFNHHFVYKVKEMENQEIYEKICGIMIETGTGRRIAATWDDKNVDVSRMEKYESRECAEAETSAEPERRVEPEMRAESEMRAELGCEALENAFHTPPANVLSGKGIMKIQRKDISKLPRCEWKLANNQFLMHGYNNYHHLLLIEEGNYLKLGVPGIYHIKEAKCAEAFGFEEFLSAEELGIVSREEENLEDDFRVTDDGEIFGYWCRFVRGRHG